MHTQQMVALFPLQFLWLLMVEAEDQAKENLLFHRWTHKLLMWKNNFSILVKTRSLSSLMYIYVELQIWQIVSIINVL